MLLLFVSYCIRSEVRRKLCNAGDDGSYGTSIERYKALDPASDIILAFKQNGRLLTPDHGYPLRIIIPGVLSYTITRSLNGMQGPSIIL